MMSTFTSLTWLLVALPVGVALYAYVLYPLILFVVSGVMGRGDRVVRGSPRDWPKISICLPVYNEEKSIRSKLENLLALDYPADRIQIMVVSDCSSDGTDAIVEEYAEQGVELLRLDRRSGKTAAENAASSRLVGDIIVNTDATIQIPPHALKPLVSAFEDPTVGVASGRDVSVGGTETEANRGESGYVGYEMWVRSLETRVGSIVGASGCFYAIRRELSQKPVPEQLSRDFASALVARENGFRAVSVNEAVCLVPRTGSLASEFRRKIRTMARGIDTLFFKKALLNPFRYGRFALMLLSHKLARWLVPLLLPVAVVGLVILTVNQPGLAVAILALIGAGIATGIAAIRWPPDRHMPRLLATCGYAFSASVAGVLAWAKVMRGDKNPIWEPTRRSEGVSVDADADARQANDADVR